jgi:NAD(P)-dependent dehydrogenase (short-subunit alcohol dehydrogenase family)
MKLKPLQDQVIVLTGATSGIGLVTARKAARAGARLVLAARNEAALQQLIDEIQNAGGDAIYAVADVGNEDQVRSIAQRATERFGGFDTWVNDAGVSIYGNLIDLSMQDQRQLFETNFWGVVHGSRVAVEHLRSRGGSLINIGSVLSERSIPLQGIYCASKHAVKGYTDSLRMELEKEGAPISVTLIKPSAIDTPYKEHAKNYLPVKPKNPPPVYAPEVVADAILHCAEHPRRDVVIGGGGRLLTALEHIAPGAADKYMDLFMFDQQKTEEQASGAHDGSLYCAGGDLRERGGYTGHVSESSVYTKAVLHPLVTSAVAVGCGLLVAIALQASTRKPEPASHIE